MKDKLFIADKIKVGFNPRTDTYTGLLGYVIGFDGKKWRKEPSWENWRFKYMDSEEFEQKRLADYNYRLNYLKKQHADYVEYHNKNKDTNAYYKQYAEMTEEQYIKTYLGPYEKYEAHLGKVSKDERIKPLEFDNVPTEGFVLNKKVGGNNYSWNPRATYTRVYDPRGFEFEISIPNLLYILQECNAYKGKGLEGSFVYAWDGKDLVLLPTSSVEYQESQKFTKLQSDKITTKDLVIGCTYKSKQMEDFVYLGKFNWTETKWLYDTDNASHVSLNKCHIFYNIKQDNFKGFNALSSFAKRITNECISNYAELLDKFQQSDNNGGLKDIIIQDVNIPKSTHNSNSKGIYYIPLGNNEYEIAYIGYNLNPIDYYSSSYKINSYEVSISSILRLNDNGDFNIKVIKNKNQTLSYTELSKLEPKKIKKQIKNNTYNLIF